MGKTIEHLQRCQIRPTTPDEFLKEDVLPELKISQVAFAQKLGVSHLTISEVLNEKRPVSVDLAWRLGEVLGNGAALWTTCNGKWTRGMRCMSTQASMSICSRCTKQHKLSKVPFTNGTRSKKTFVSYRGIHLTRTTSQVTIKA